MFVKHHASVIEDKIPLSFCDDILKLCSNKENESGQVGGNLKVLTKIRDSNISWVDEPWAYHLIEPFVFEANKAAGWNFILTKKEQLQFTKYSYTSKQHYNWHIDNDLFPDGQKNPIPFRKLSFTVQLSEPEEYEGGELLIDTGITDQKIHSLKDFKKKGTIIVFPSFMKHKINPITKGVRHSLVGWYGGPEFR